MASQKFLAYFVAAGTADETAWLDCDLGLDVA
jgi:hypothetical protein